MNMLPLSVAIAAALGLAACGDDAPKPETSRSNAPASSAPSTASSSPGDASTSTGGAGAAPSSSTGVSRSSEGISSSASPGGANVHQQQVDPKDAEQRKDFQQSGDDKGPTSAETQPKPGN